MGSNALKKIIELEPKRVFTVVLLVAAASATIPTVAFAQERQSPTAPLSEGAIASPSSSPLPTPSKAKRDPLLYKRFDALIEPGPTTSFPGASDSILGDTGGIRSALASHDIGIQARLSGSVIGDVLQTGQPYEPQRYAGQRFTLQSQAMVVTGTFGLGSLGLPNSKFIVAGTYNITSYKPAGPTAAIIRTLAYYQSFADGKVAVKIGWVPNYYEFVGLFVGGSPVLSSGLSGLIPIQAGLSADPTPAPTANLYFTAKNGAYARFAVQRSVSPGGSIEEVAHNGIGLKFSQKGSGPLTIGEIGLRRAASETSHQIWLRAGAIYNDSDYSRFDGKGTASNKAVYAAADYQLTQIDKAHPARGVYVGASAFGAPKNVNVYTQTFEARTYAVGLFNARPSDSITFRVTYNKFSKDARDADRLKGLYANDSQLSASVGYSYHAGAGIYLVPSVAYIHHPSFIGDFKDAVTLTGAVYLVL